VLIILLLRVAVEVEFNTVAVAVLEDIDLVQV
jgi:hypothetical protein